MFQLSWQLSLLTLKMVMQGNLDCVNPWGEENFWNYKKRCKKWKGGEGKVVLVYYNRIEKSASTKFYYISSFNN